MASFERAAGHASLVLWAPPSLHEIVNGRRLQSHHRLQRCLQRLLHRRIDTPVAAALAAETQLLETAADPAGRCQVVRWLRTFPFAFLSQREYVIARRFFREEDGLYAVTRGLVEHPAAPRVPGQVRMESFLRWVGRGRSRSRVAQPGQPHAAFWGVLLASSATL